MKKNKVLAASVGAFVTAIILTMATTYFVRTTVPIPNSNGAVSTHYGFPFFDRYKTETESISGILCQGVTCQMQGYERKQALDDYSAAHDRGVDMSYAALNFVIYLVLVDLLGVGFLYSRYNRKRQA